MKMNPNYKWYNPEKHNTVNSAKPATRPSNAFVVYHGEKPHTLDVGITPGKLAGQYLCDCLLYSRARELEHPQSVNGIEVGFMK